MFKDCPLRYQMYPFWPALVLLKGLLIHNLIVIRVFNWKVRVAVLFSLDFNVLRSFILWKTGNRSLFVEDHYSTGFLWLASSFSIVLFASASLTALFFSRTLVIVHFSI